MSASWVRLACTASYPAVVIFPSSVQFVEFAAQVGELLSGFARVALVDFAADLLKFLRQLVGRFAIEAAGLPLLLDHVEERGQAS